MAQNPLRAGLVGAGKMGLSHLAILGAHPDVDVVAICDNQGLVTSAIKSQTGIETYKDARKMMRDASLDCVFIATPSASHFEVASQALERGLHVFAEKPLTLDAAESQRLAQMAEQRGLANQVGYHYRFVGPFQEMRRLVTAGAIGSVHHIEGKAFGPVVVKEKSGFTWRAKRGEGGGCLHDYASHVIDLMNWMVGPPRAVVGAQLQSVFSKDVEDTVHALFRYDGGLSGRLEANWSDESYRKMSTTITAFGTTGKIVSDRQECQVFLKPGCEFEKYTEGWNIRYITELQAPVRYYLRGEEYTAQIDAFVDACRRRDPAGQNSFTSAAQADRVVELIARAHEAAR